jgi:arginine repressor
VIRRYAMKTKRQRKIIELITNYDIETQEELAAKLVENGFNVTQATISRDIRELNLTKIATKGGKQKYAVQSSSDIVSNSKYMRVLNDGIITMDTAGNILVVKTVSGMAMAVAAALDAMQIKEILGCIAGDDTIMCVVKHAEETDRVKEHIESFIR